MKDIAYAFIKQSILLLIIDISLVLLLPRPQPITKYLLKITTRLYLGKIEYLSLIRISITFLELHKLKKFGNL